MFLLTLEFYNFYIYILYKILKFNWMALSYFHTSYKNYSWLIHFCNLEFLINHTLTLWPNFFSFSSLNSFNVKHIRLKVTRTVQCFQYFWKIDFSYSCLISPFLAPFLNFELETFPKFLIYLIFEFLTLKILIIYSLYNFL